MIKIQPNSVVNSAVNQRSVGQHWVTSHDVTAALALNTTSRFALCMESHYTALIITAQNVSHHIRDYSRTYSYVLWNHMLWMVVILSYAQFSALTETWWFNYGNQTVLICSCSHSLARNYQILSSLFCIVLEL